MTERESRADHTDVEPMEIDGANLLDRVRAALTKYVAFANEHQSVAVTLWIAATHALPAWDHATRLAITSPQKRCAKSRLLDVAAAMSHSALLCADSTTAAIYRSLSGPVRKFVVGQAARGCAGFPACMA